MKVQYDENSIYSWDELHEKKFVSNVLSILSDSEFFKEFDFYIFANNKSENLPKSINYQGSKVLIYLSDESGRVPSELENSYDFIFKNYLRSETEVSKYLPLGLPSHHYTDCLEFIAPSNDFNGLFFAGNLNRNRIELYREFNFFLKMTPRFASYWLFRKLGCSRFISLFKIRPKNSGDFILFSDGFMKGLSPSNYYRKLKSSNIVLCPKGFSSTETFRHYEALRLGKIVISEKLYPENYFKNSPILQIENWSKLSEVLNNCRESGKLAKMQEESIKWYNTHFSERAVANYMSEKVRK